MLPTTIASSTAYRRGHFLKGQAIITLEREAHFGVILNEDKIYVHEIPRFPRENRNMPIIVTNVLIRFTTCAMKSH